MCIRDRSASERVRALGVRVGVAGLSAHDCRHYAMTNAAHHGTDPLVLQEFGGWKSLDMPRRYVEDRKVANDQVQMIY